MKQHPTPHWFLIADGKQARLLKGWRLQNDRRHLEEVASLAGEPAGRQHHRPSALGGMSGHSFAPFSHEREEDLRRFVGQLVEWVGRLRTTHGIDQLHVFGPARFLGELRQHVRPETLASTTLHTAELMHMDAGELARHPEVQQLVGS